MDPGLAPDGFHIATTYGFFFPCEAPKEERGRLCDEMAERILDRLSEFLPDLRECIVERAVFSWEHFATMQGATNGDFTHGLIHPEQMIGGRLLVPGSAHATPIAGLYLCGASCHPGPGVTFLLRDDHSSQPKVEHARSVGAAEVVRALSSATAVSSRTGRGATMHPVRLTIPSTSAAIPARCRHTCRD